MWGPNFDTLTQRLDLLVECFSCHDVKPNLSKCAFGQKQVKFLGHIVSEEGCRPGPSNVEAVKTAKPPTNVKEVRRFLGRCGFYRKHVPQSAKIAAPLTNLTRDEEEFRWNDRCQETFEELKTRLTQAPFLVKADIQQPFIVTTDPSHTHVGGVFSQVHPEGSNKAFGYFSRKLKGEKFRYPATDKETLAVVLTCRNFWHYLNSSYIQIISL